MTRSEFVLFVATKDSYIAYIHTYCAYLLIQSTLEED